MIGLETPAITFLEAAEDERRADACIWRPKADRAGERWEAGGHLGFYGEGEADGDGRPPRQAVAGGVDC